MIAKSAQACILGAAHLGAWLGRGGVSKIEGYFNYQHRSLKLCKNIEVTIIFRLSGVDYRFDKFQRKNCCDLRSENEEWVLESSNVPIVEKHPGESNHFSRRQYLTTWATQTDNESMMPLNPRNPKNWELKKKKLFCELCNAFTFFAKSAVTFWNTVHMSLWDTIFWSEHNSTILCSGRTR